MDYGSRNMRNFDQKDSVAFLLGAGFSIPMGYPKGADVNNGILDFDKQPVAFSPAGVLATNTDGTKPDFGYTNNHEQAFRLCKDLIAAYNKRVVEFDYEQFRRTGGSASRGGMRSQVELLSSA